MSVIAEDVLIVDDEKAFRESVGPAFEQYGFAVEAVDPGEVKALVDRGSRPGTAIVDLYMPVIDGIAVAEILTRGDPDVVLFFLTAQLETQQFRARAKKLGLRVAAWLEKPLPDSDREANSFFRTLHERILDQRFANLTDRWRREVGFMSSTSQMSMNPSYQRIIGLGPTVVPLIIRELRKEPEHWFWALKAITGQDPVDESARGDVDSMRTAWVTWAENKGIA